jgi:hypothetical protein
MQQQQVPGGDPAAAVAPEEQPKAEDQKEPRDYPSELLQRLGNPASCLSPRVNDGTAHPFQIGIAAQLMPSGALARTDLTAPELSSAERACLAQRVGAVHLAGPIEGAPLGIQTSLTLQPSAAASAAAPTAKANADGMGAEPGQAAEPSPFLEPTPEAAEVPAAPPVHIGAESTTP